MTSSLPVALALLLPTLLAYAHGPAAGFHGQLLALSLWALVMLLAPRRHRLAPDATLLLACLALLGIGVIRAAWDGNASLAIEPMMVLMAAAMVLGLGACGDRQSLTQGLAWGCLAVGIAGALIAFVQVLLPGLADGFWIVQSTMPGRAIGNMRQPNHLATWLLLAIVALTWLGQHRQWPLWVMLIGLQALLLALLLTGSRSGLLAGVPLLMLWAVAARDLDRRSRLLLLATPLMVALAWALLQGWAAAGHTQFVAAQRLDQEGAGSPKRLQILLNTWQLLSEHPWLGVGWGSFNRAWTLTPFADRPVAFFDHSHNLVLQLLVELGFVHGGLLVLLLGLAFSRMALRWLRNREERDPLSLVFPMLALLGVHSLLEYPLWHPYFLLPAALMAGLSLKPPTADSVLRWPARLPQLLGLLVLSACALALFSYHRVAQVFVPSDDGRPLLLRLDQAVRDPIYGFHGDYAAAVTLDPGEQAEAAAHRAARHFVDARLLKSWANSLQAIGDTDKARYLSARVAEFGPMHSADWLAECSDPSKAWRCEPPEVQYRWTDF